MIAHPDRATTLAARANRDRCASIVEPPRVECCWCGHVMSEGAGPVSHGICDNEWCQKLQTETIYPWRVRALALDMAEAYGRWNMSDAASTAKWNRAKRRHQMAHEKMVEDYEAEIRRLRVAAAETREARE